MFSFPGPLRWKISSSNWFRMSYSRASIRSLTMTPICWWTAFETYLMGSWLVLLCCGRAEHHIPCKQLNRAALRIQPAYDTAVRIFHIKGAITTAKLTSHRSFQVTTHKRQRSLAIGISASESDEWPLKLVNKEGYTPKLCRLKGPPLQVVDCW